jgi:hypothetical protein
MIQPIAKLRFVERYCSPSDGWSVFVDIDASEEGRTGSERRTATALARHARVLEEAPLAVRQLEEIGAFVGDRKRKWINHFGTGLAVPRGDRDIIAVHQDRRLLWVVEVEGDSGGQPEGKIYKALGQLLCAVTESRLDGFESSFTLVAWGDAVAVHLARARAASQIGISGLAIAEVVVDDRWLFGRPVHLETS